MEKLKACPVCGSSTVMTILEIETADKVSEYWVCNCGAAYLNPRMDQAEMVEYYRSGKYRERTAATLPDDMEAACQYHRGEALARILEPFHVISHLDIGCSSGELLKAVAKDRHIISTGVDLDPKWTKHVKYLYPTIESTPLSVYDLITMVHTLEHIHYPSEYLKIVKSKLMQGGILVIIVPDRDMWQAAYVVPEHLVAFNLHSLLSLIIRTGLYVVGMIPRLTNDPTYNGCASLIATNDVQLYKRRGMKLS